jgi:hypothetical protein
MISIQLSFDFSHFFFSIGVNSIVQDEFCHSHSRYESMYVLKRHVDMAVVI